VLDLVLDEVVLEDLKVLHIIPTGGRVSQSIELQMKQTYRSTPLSKTSMLSGRQGGSVQALLELACEGEA
jgi:hypothetical protein